MDQASIEPTPRLMIAIAGPTSSGKTTLSYLLYEVFANHTANKSSGLTSTIIHQDAFFHPHGLLGAPQRQWIEYGQADRDPDGKPIVSTLTSMRVGSPMNAQMFLIQGRRQAFIDAYEKALIESNASGSSSTPTHREPSVDNLLWTIKSGEDRDTRAVIDWAAFTQALEVARISGEDPTPTTFNPFNAPSRIANAETRAAEKEADKAHALSLVSPAIIAQLRRKVKAWAVSTSALNSEAKFPGHAVRDGRLRGMAFVEGFLLLADPRTHNGANEQIIRSFDTKLFLYETKGISRIRRFARRAYTDSERQPWMTWRSESYFDGVAWPAFVAEHLWLVDVALPTPAMSASAKAFGVVGRMDPEAGVEETLVWAVDSVLESLDAKEAAERNAWVMNPGTGFIEPASMDETVRDPLGDDWEMSASL